MLVLESCKLNGEMNAPLSKSILHREIIAGCLSSEVSTIKNVGNLCEDIKATIDCLIQLGCDIKITDNKIECSCGRLFDNKNDVILDAKESGTTYRILSEFKHICKGKVEVTMQNEEVRNKEVKEYEIYGSEIHIDCSITTQILSGLLFVLPLLKEKYTIHVENLNSKSYIDLTLQTLERHGIYTKNEDYQKFTTFPSEYKAVAVEVEGDYSNSSPFIIANLLGNNVKIHKLNLLSKQADKEIINILNYEPKIINANNTPDIILVLSLWACFRDSDTIITNVDKLRYKESDRVKAILELNKLGADIVELDNRLIIRGKGKDFNFTGGKVSCYNDHRIAMMFAIASTRLSGSIEIDNETCVNKSFPNFWEVFEGLKCE